MHSTDIKLFGEILEEVSIKKYNEAISAMDDARCSEKHYRRMIKILGIEVEPYIPHHKWRLRTQILAIIITIMIVLTGCAAAVIMINEEIRDAIIEFFDDYLVIRYNEDVPQQTNTIDEPYILTYIPDGYDQTEEVINPIIVSYKWQNSEGESIVFRQETLDGSKQLIDNEEGELINIEKWGVQIKCCISENSFRYFWNDGKYSMIISSTSEIVEYELEAIIKGIKTK